jgi:hypothetical protein
MGYHPSITPDRMPGQGRFKGARVRVLFHYNTTNPVLGTCVRDDAEHPWVQFFSLDDGRYVLASECQWQTLRS